MSRVVNGEMLFKDREKEVLRKMIWQVADFSGVEVLTYCVMSNHFHVLLRVPEKQELGDEELLRRYAVLYPKPTEHQMASVSVLRVQLAAGSSEAAELRQKLLLRMGDISQYMKTLKQRFSVWYNRNHDRYGTLWADRFKSVLVEGRGHALQTIAAYIDLNSVRAGLVEDPKDYRFCGYGEAVSGRKLALSGLRQVWAGFDSDPLRAHRLLIFGKGAQGSGAVIDRSRVLQVLEREDGQLSKAEVLRCRVRYFTDGAILGSAAFVQSFAETWQEQGQRRYPPKVNTMKAAVWGDLAVIRGLRKQVFG
jgi:REP element-mobilizing transposase RayT